MKKNDAINPSHYGAGDGKIECMDVMIQQFGADQYAAFCLLNAFKYLYRCEHKHDTPLEDVKKAHWYLTTYIALAESNEGLVGRASVDSDDETIRAQRMNIIEKLYEEKR